MVIVAPESWDYQAAASKTMLESMSCVVLPVRLVSFRLDHPLFAPLEYYQLPLDVILFHYNKSRSSRRKNQ